MTSYPGPGAQPASFTMGTRSSLGVKRQGRGVDHPPLCSAQVKGRVELYLYSPSSWPVLGSTLPLPVPYPVNKIITPLWCLYGPLDALTGRGAKPVQITGARDQINSGRLEIFRIKAYFDFPFRVREFPFNPEYLTFVSAPKSWDRKIFPFKTNSV